MVIDFYHFTYGIKIFIIDKSTLKTELQKIIKPNLNETLEEMLERILLEYNIKDFVFKPKEGCNHMQLEQLLINKGFNKYIF